MASPVEIDAMRRAIVLSAFGFGTTSPNPPVGCVILDSAERIIGEGYHARKGEPHAETQALAQAGTAARGGTAVVTLEPCNHHGRTPPCHQALIDGDIARVVISVIDPTSRGAGGAAILRSAGLDVEVGVLDQETRLVLDPWLAAIEQQRPFVTMMYAVDSGGRMQGLLSTDSRSPYEAVVDARALRLVHDAVLLDDGQLEEGVPGAHRADTFHLLTRPPAESGAMLATLFDGGVRSLLVDGSCLLSNVLVMSDLVDQVVSYTGGDSSSTRRAAAHAEGSGGPPAGFALRDVTRVGQVVRARSVRVRLAGQ